MKHNLKITVLGGSGLIGSKLVKILQENGHAVLSASRTSGVDVLTGAGLAEAFNGAEVVVDVMNSPSFEDKAVMEFFETAGKNIVAAEEAAGVRHHVALSVVGTERLLSSGYFRAKMAQETRIKAAKIPYTIVRATQFFEFVETIANFATEGQKVRLPHTLFQPIVSDDVALALAKVATAEPLNGMVEVAGPEAIALDDIVRTLFRETGDAREVVTDPHAPYYGVEVDDRSLTPGENPMLGTTRFADWLKHNLTATQAVV